MIFFCKPKYKKVKEIMNKSVLTLFFICAFNRQNYFCASCILISSTYHLIMHSIFFCWGHATLRLAVSLCPLVCPSVDPSSMPPSIRLTLCLSVHPSVYLSDHLFVCLSFHLSVCPSVCLLEISLNCEQFSAQHKLSIAAAQL